MRLYRPMLKQAVAITWRNKVLWFFGLFSALLTSGGAYNIGLGNFEKVEAQGLRLNNFKNFLQHWTLNFGSGGKIDIMDVWQTVGIWGIFLMLIILAVVVFLFWLAVSSQGALVFGLGRTVEKKEFNFNQLFRQGMHKFWAVLLLNLIFGVVLLTALLLLSLPFFILFMSTSQTVIWQSILVVLSFLVWVPLAAVLFIIIRYALIYTVNQEEHVGEALSKAFSLFAKNWIVSLETALLLFVLNLISGLVLALAMIFVAVPFVMLAIIAVQLSSSMFFWLVILCGALVFITILFLYGALWNVFSMANWVILFDKIQQGPVYSKIWRWAINLSGHKKEIKTETVDSFEE